MFRQLKQASVIISSAFQRMLSYQFSVITYRIGEVAEVLVLVLMWTAIYSGGNGMVKGFTLNEMITYVLVGNLCAVAVRSFLPPFVARDIEEGRLSMFLVKPIPYIKYVFLNELGRIFLSTVLSLVSQLCVILFFLDRIFINTDWRYIGLILAMLLFAFIIELLIGFLIGTIAFWTEEVTGLQTTLERIKRFFSGGYFPISLLPVYLITASKYLPFQYSFFAPAQLYLKKVDLRQGLEGILIQIIWVVLLSLIVRVVWRMGLRKYEAVGS